MGDQGGYSGIEQIKQAYPAKFADEREIFTNIHPGNRIFIGTACAEPQYLVKSLINYVNPIPRLFSMPSVTGVDVGSGGLYAGKIQIKFQA